jgi:hypothetical protein
MCPGAQNMKMGPDALGTAEIESGRAKHENKTPRPRYRGKRVRERKKKKTVPDALGTAENESERGKHENGTRSWFHRKRFC